jgi:hypothetical protein
VALTLGDPDHHPPAVDIAGLQRHGSEMRKPAA